MSLVGQHLTSGQRALPNAFYKARPQVLRVVIETLGRAISATVAAVGAGRLDEPKFTRQLFLDLQHARDNTPGSPRYDITHQPELPIADANGKMSSLRRLDLRLLFLSQVGRTGDYLCIECKYLDTTDRSLDREYVDDGVERIVAGDYAKDHPWAIMVGLERTGPLDQSAAYVNARLTTKYGNEGAFRRPCSIQLPNVEQSEHLQAGGPHRITVLHSFFLIAATA